MGYITEIDLIKSMASDLRKENIPVQTEVSLGGIRPDMVVTTPDGRHIIIEVKLWSPANRKRAAEQVKRYKDITGVDKVFLVMPELKRSHPQEGIVAPEDLVATIFQEWRQAGPSQQKEKPVKTTQRRIFAAMPFAPRYDDVYFVAMVPAADAVGAACDRVDHAVRSGDIVEHIKRMITDSIAVVADLSESRADVLYEVGYAHALKRPTIHICSTPLERLPFDIRNWMTLPYEQGQTYRLKDELVRSLKDVLGIS
jgi:hypothetical protein